MGEEFQRRIRTEAWRKLGHWNRIPPFEGQGLATKRLGEIDFYLSSGSVFAPTDKALYESRLKVLGDGKQLVMATPRVKDGFYELPCTVGRELWPRAVRAHEVCRYGRRLATTFDALGRVDVMLTGAVAVSAVNGVRVGKGTGYGDLDGVLCDWGAWVGGRPSSLSSMTRRCPVKSFHAR